MSNYLCIQMSFKIQWVLFRTWIHELEIKREWFITLSLLIILYVSEEIYIKISQLSMSFNKTIMWMCRFPKRYTIPKLLLSLIPPPLKKTKKKTHSHHYSATTTINYTKILTCTDINGINSFDYLRGWYMLFNIFL